jgi:hypothetical protein
MIKFGRLFYGLRNNPKAEGPVGLVNTAIQRWIDEALAKGQGFGLVRSDLPQTMLIDAVMGMGMALDHWMVAHWEEMSPDMRVLVSKQQMDLIRRVVAP